MVKFSLLVSLLTRTNCFLQKNAIKYICRHAHKGEVQDLEKAKHYIDMIIERDYGY